MWLNLLKKFLGKPLKNFGKYRMREGSVSRNKTNIMKDQYLVYKEHMNFPRSSLCIIPPIGLSMDLRNILKFLIRFLQVDDF